MLERDDMAMLRLAERYGDGLDLSGPKVAKSRKVIARELLLTGYLMGKLKSLSLTDKARDVLRNDTDN